MMHQHRTAWVAFGIALLTGAGACSSSTPSAPSTIDEAGRPAAPSAVDRSAILRAEDARRTADLPEGALTSRDLGTRRLAVRALARIADEASAAPLLAALSDEDPEVVSLAAYGIGFVCKGKESAMVRALAARAATWTTRQHATTYVAPEVAIARSVAKCAAPESEPMLSSWLRGSAGAALDAGTTTDTDVLGEAAALALGDLASKKKTLSDESLATLLAFGRRNSRARSAALYPLGRVSNLANAAEGARELAIAALTSAGDAGVRPFAARLLGKTGTEGVPPLALLLDDPTANGADAVEAARSLGALGPLGKKAAAAALEKRLPAPDAFALQKLTGPEFAIVSTLLASLGPVPNRDARAVLTRLTDLRAPGEPPPVLARRLADLRCEAAALLAADTRDAKLVQCDATDGYAGQKARLAVLVRAPLKGAALRREWYSFTKSAHLRIREAAIEALTTHAELGDTGTLALREALASDKGGLVATAADVIHAHPERAMVLSAKEKRAALDPRSPPPGPEPERETDRELKRALAVAMAHPWKADAFETRLALLDAAVAIAAPEARATAIAACKSPNATVRDRAAKAMRALGEPGICPLPAKSDVAAPEIAKGLGGGRVALKLVTDTGELGILLDPDLTPVTTLRIASLAEAGFYNGVLVHRVVPGFVAQFGDPEGDGYGGSGTPLRCETSPAPFEAFDVGMALAGRDTGSSQLFVTLARTPHLDGEYARVGHATGDWSAVAQGDVIREVRVDRSPSP